MNADIPPATAPAHRYSTRLPATTRGARFARHCAIGQLLAWGWAPDTEASRTAALLVAELAANAITHGRHRGRQFRLTLTLYPADPTLRIEVTDARPERRPPTPGTLPPVAADAESGRGLVLVEVLSTHWGTTCGDPYTKTVWCEVALK
ncbi:ATP-binding protein [Streptomyces sp. NPDC056716]|uniref:ATP-binding protein n=1 Tax=unclassified Streptomyces TaxID=2593676 RepID=UPI003678BD01